MLGINSENLRVHVTVADYLKKEIDISIGNPLFSLISIDVINIAEYIALLTFQGIY